MDKVAANNLITGLKKDTKKAKVMVSGNLVRKISKLKREKEQTDDSDKAAKLEAKIDSILNDIKLMKTLDTYDIAKRAVLQPDVKHWIKTMGDTKALPEERLIARVIQKNVVQKRVKNFTAGSKDYSEWINEYFEFREKKKALTS